MKKIVPVILIVAILLAGFPFVSAGAQIIPGQIIDSTIPVSQDLRDALNSWLTVSPPSAAPYYAVTYVQPTGMDTFVSVVGLNLSDPDEAWSLEDGGQAVWIGTVIVLADGSVQPYSVDPPSAYSFHLAMPSLAAGGGSYVKFPWQSGKKAMYGPRSIHGDGDYGTSGMKAVDFVSGDDYGSGAAPATVYASDAGVVDYVCTDGTTVAIRTHNTSTGDYFIYAHLLSNSNLSISHNFSVRGALVGSLKRGTFDDDCGWANQADNHYHLHWMFTPANGAFQAENCILGIASKKWTCGGSQTVGTGQWLFSTGGSGGIDDPNGTGTTSPSFFDYLLVGILTIVDQGIIKLLPEHTSPTLILLAIFNSAKLVLRVAYILVKGNFNVGPFLAMLFIALAFRFVIGIIWFIASVWRTIKGLPLVP